MNDWAVGAASVIALLIAFILGWIASSMTVSWECRNVGVFYISSGIYDCQERKEKP
jgi:hypothetical protein